MTVASKYYLTMRGFNEVLPTTAMLNLTHMKIAIITVTVGAIDRSSDTVTYTYIKLYTYICNWLLCTTKKALNCLYENFSKFL